MFHFNVWQNPPQIKKKRKQTKKKKKSYFPQAIATLGTQMVPLQRYAKMIKDCREKRYLLISDKKTEVLCQLWQLERKQCFCHIVNVTTLEDPQQYVFQNTNSDRKLEEYQLEKPALSRVTLEEQKQPRGRI